MSAIAATRLPNKIVMLSDGRANQYGEVYSTSFRKVYKVDDSCGFFWLGNYPDPNCMPDMKAHLKTCNDDVVSGAADHLERLYTRYPDVLNGVDDKRFIVILLNGSKRYGFDSNFADPFTPMPSTINVGKSLYFDIEGTNNGPAYQRKVQQKINTGMEPVKACKAGFRKLMDELSSKGIKVGGEVFCEVIQPREQPAFPEALRN